MARARRAAARSVAADSSVAGRRVITIRRGRTFFITDEVGNVAGDRRSGLYCHDSRFLSRYELTLDRHRLVPLTARVVHGSEGVHFLTNDAGPDTPRGGLGVVRSQQILDGEFATRWLVGEIDCNRDGLVAYYNEVDAGLADQGWKDSWDSVRFRDGSLAKGAIALVEVQGYAIDALERTAELFESIGNAALGRQLRRRALRLRAVLRSRFRLADRPFFAQALDGSGARVDALTSNPGHLLWSRALPDGDARLVARILLSEEMFSGFGIRTMGAAEGAYNPLSYHNGSVWPHWPHDCSLILAGLSGYDLRDEAASLAARMLAAVSRFPDRRLPELFAGYSSAYGVPVDYPTSNRPQAWAAGAIILLVRAILGIDVDAPARRLVTRPIAVPGITQLVLRRVPIGAARVDFELAAADGRPSVRVHGIPKGWRHEHGPVDRSF